MTTLLIVLAVFALLGAMPVWPHSRTWGYGPTSGLGMLLGVALLLYLAARY